MKSAAWWPRSFRSQTALILGGMVIVLAAALTGTFAVLLTNTMHRDQGITLDAVGQSAANALTSGMEDGVRLVQSLVESPQLWKNGLASPEVLQALERAHRTTSHSAWLGVATNDGTVAAAADGVLVGVSVSARDWFQAGKQGPHVGDVHAAKLLAKLMPKAADGEPVRFVGFSAPIMVDGQLLGVVGLHGNWQWARSIARPMVSPASSDLGVELFILGVNGDALPSHRLAEPARL